MRGQAPRPGVGAILAGGLARRLGGAKPAVVLAGRPLVEHVLGAVEAAGLEPVVVAKRDSSLPALSCRTLREPPVPVHPACGIVAALRESDGRGIVVVGCDMPFVSADLLAWLAATAEPLVLPELEGGLEPFPGRYDAALLPALEAALAAGEPLRRALARLSPRRVSAAELARFGPPERLVFNVNTPTDLARAAAMLDEPAG